MARFKVVYDACVLYPAPLRDALMRQALTGLYRARWTDAIHEEWMRNLLANRPDLSRVQLERTRELMNRHVEDALVDGYQYLIPSLSLPDPNDRHVLAAAIHSHASVIVTFNLKDFPAVSLEPYEIEAQHPDEFLAHLLDLNAAATLAAFAQHRQSLKHPPKTVSEYLDILQRQGLPATTRLLKPLAAAL
ncbi:PIN domain-containing protein [Chromobacterium vaccinii]|uniref:PIN domain-containing protein n=1 Tax=Chromobacterium vaccinii TaxID=1108595 RepID=UPI003C75A3B7